MGSGKYETAPLGYWIVRVVSPRMAMLFEPDRVKGGAFAVIVWPLIMTVDAPMTAFISCPATVAMGIGASTGGFVGDDVVREVGLGTKLAGPALP